MEMQRLEIEGQILIDTTARNQAEFFNKLLQKINALTSENEALRAELEELKNAKDK